MSDIRGPKITVVEPAPMNPPGTVERAYQLARSGDCVNVDAIRTMLSREGHSAVQEHLSGPTIRRELAKLCRESQA